jgi:hypothetical protein
MNSDLTVDCGSGQSIEPVLVLANFAATFLPGEKDGSASIRSAFDD